MKEISKSNMPYAYKEVNEILKYVCKKERNLIPDSFYKLINAKMDKEYNYYYDGTKEFNEHEMLPETRAILGYIYLEYWADENEKQIIESKLKNDLIHAEEKKIENYNPNDIFKTAKEDALKNMNEQLHQDVHSLAEFKESFLKRLMNKIKNFFRIK